MKRSHIKNVLILISLLAISITSCHQGKESGQEALREPSIQDSTVIVISKEQFLASDMELGNPKEYSFEQKVSAIGYIQASPQGKNLITSNTPGKIEQIFVNEGQKVNKGTLLLKLSSNEGINIQQEYAESVAMLSLSKSNYERNRILSEENITAKKEFEKSESEYRTLLARTEALKAKLKIMSLDPEKVAQGNITPYISVYCNLNGSVSNLDITMGQFVEPNTTLMEVIDNDQLQLNLYVFRKDMVKLAPGQLVRYYDPDQDTIIYEAKLKRIGVSVDENLKRIRCIAEINPDDKGNFLDGGFFETEVITCKRKAYALPAEALIQENSNYYILIKKKEDEENYYFSKVAVKVGVIQNEFAEILEDNVNDILVKGVYNLSGE